MHSFYTLYSKYRQKLHCLHSMIISISIHPCKVLIYTVVGRLSSSFLHPSPPYSWRNNLCIYSTLWISSNIYTNYPQEPDFMFLTTLHVQHIHVREGREWKCCSHFPCTCYTVLISSSSDYTHTNIIIIIPSSLTVCPYTFPERILHFM